MARLDPQVNFRLPEQLRQKLQDAAELSKRTLTAEIVARLEQSFQPAVKDDVYEALLHPMPMIGTSPGNVAITTRWTVVIDEADAAKLAKMHATEKPTKLGFTSLDENHVVLTVTPKTQAKALLTNKQALAIRSLLGMP